MSGNKGRPKQVRVYWPEHSPEAKPHERNFYRSLGSKKLKGAAREAKVRRLMAEVFK